MTIKTPHAPCPVCGGPKSRQAAVCQICYSAQLRAKNQNTCPGCGGRKHWCAAQCRACYELGVSQAATFADEDRPFPLSGDEAAHYGAIVSFRNAAGQAYVAHRKGPVKAAVKEACQAATALDPTFKVTAVSTPTSVYADLQGARVGEGGSSAHPRFPERSQVPRELLHESLR
jgi:hypothetical protein